MTTQNPLTFLRKTLEHCTTPLLCTQKSFYKKYIYQIQTKDSSIHVNIDVKKIDNDFKKYVHVFNTLIPKRLNVFNEHTHCCSRVYT